jgi:hypothetical protein
MRVLRDYGFDNDVIKALPLSVAVKIVKELTDPVGSGSSGKPPIKPVSDKAMARRRDKGLS